MEEPKLGNSNVTTPTLLPSKHILVEKTSKRRVSMVTGEKTLKIGWKVKVFFTDVHIENIFHRELLYKKVPALV